MSIATAITNLSGRIQDAYDALEAKGATIPATKNTANLSACIDSIPAGGGGSNILVRDTEGYNKSNTLSFDGTEVNQGVMWKNVNTVNFTNHAGYMVINAYLDDGTVYNGEFNDSFQVALNGRSIYIVNAYSTCLLRGTMITLSNGSEKPIEDINYDDELLVWDFDNGCMSKAKPIWIKKAETTDYWFQNRYKSGKVLKTTGKSETGWGHRTFDLNKNKFIYTTESVSDRIFTLDGVDTHMSCERIEQQCEFYNVITEKHFNLFANRILTSCSLNNLYPIKNMKYVKDDRKLRKFEDYSGITQEYFNGLRLSENNSDIEKLNSYVSNLLKIRRT